MKIVTLGLSISSSWGNGHTSTYRSLYKGLAGLGHELYFLERNHPEYLTHRDVNSTEHYELIFYNNIDDLHQYRMLIADADAVIVGSSLQEGIGINDWVIKHANGLKIFYDIDAPLTLERLNHYEFKYITPGQIPLFDLYLANASGDILEVIERKFNAKSAQAFYCSYDPDLYFSTKCDEKWLLGYLGTYSFDRQRGLEQLLLQPAQLYPGSYVVAGPSYPDQLKWPDNVQRIEHLSNEEHCRFYCLQRFTLSVTRKAAKAIGHSPNARLFEAAACGTAIISDWWEGVDELFTPGEEILIANTTKDIIEIFEDYDEDKATRIGLRARQKVIEKHSNHARAKQLEELINQRSGVLV